MTREKRMQYEHELLENWDFLLDGIDDDEARLNTAIVLQNSFDQTVQEGGLNEDWLEQLNEGDQQLNEAPMKTSATHADGRNVIPNVLFPVIRRVFPSLIANQLVSVQPIQSPTGVIYYIDYTFSDTKGNITSGDEYSANANQTSPAYAVHYSSEKLGPVTVDIAADGSGVADFANQLDFFGGTNPVWKRVEVYGQSLTGVLQNNVAKFFNVGSATGEVDVDVTVGAGSATFDTSSGLTEGTYKVFAVYDQESSANIPDMEFSIRSSNVSTTERKLRIRWTKESEQDMRAYHKIDVESELVKVASMEMNYEIDREILRFIGDIVTPELSFYHDWTNDASSTGNNSAGNYLDRHRAMAQKMYQASAKIAQYNRQGPASWAVVSPQTAAILNMLPDYKGEIAGGTFSVFEAGQLGSGLKIYVDPNRHGSEATEILLGFKSSNSTYGAGVVYSPYTNWMSNTIQNPDNFDSVRGFFQRYALHKVDRGQWHYAKVTLDNVAI